jgi:hypothetical protein
VQNLHIPQRLGYELLNRIDMEKINRECKNDNHVRRDNKFGITWCVRCGRLFTKPSGKHLAKEDKLRFNCL